MSGTWASSQIGSRRPSTAQVGTQRHVQPALDIWIHSAIGGHRCVRKARAGRSSPLRRFSCAGRSALPSREKRSAFLGCVCVSEEVGTPNVSSCGRRSALARALAMASHAIGDGVIHGCEVVAGGGPPTGGEVALAERSRSRSPLSAPLASRWRLGRAMPLNVQLFAHADISRAKLELGFVCSSCWPMAAFGGQVFRS